MSTRSISCPAARRVAGSVPVELIRAATGVRSSRGILVAAPPRAAQKVGRTGSGSEPGEQEQPLSAVRGADVAGSYATPDRVIPCLGQVSKYTVQAAGTEGSHVLHNDKPGV